MVTATADTPVGQAPLTVNFQGTSPLTVTSWNWDFGDGATSTEQNPSHTYASVGYYTVNLTITHADGTNYLRQTDYIKAYDPPTAGFTANVTEGPYPLTVGFTDQSTNVATSWNWDFGDGSTSTVQNPVHTYTSTGTFTVTLTATNPVGSNTTTQTDYITVSAPTIPEASFTASRTVGVTPLTIQFNDTSLYNPTSWLWDFGDGNTSTEQNPAHTYSYAGTFTVSLNATNTAGSDTATRTEYISASDPAAPTASFTVSQRVGISPLTIRFTDTSKDYPTSWLWDFGDGNTSTDQNPTHTYTAVGTYTVSLTATNAEGSNATTRIDHIVVIGTELAPLPAEQSFNLYVANDEGVKYNVENGVTGPSYTPYVFIDNTYHFLYNGRGGGTNALHVSNDPTNKTGHVIQTANQSGEFWLTFSGGQDNLHDAVLLLAVNGTIPDDFSVRIRSSGYDFEPPIPSIINNNTIGNPVYVDGAINQTFTKEDFFYGPQIWRPHRVSDYPVFVGQNMSDTENTFELMFIDLRAGCIKMKTDGAVRVEYEFTNLTTFAVFNAYGWYSASNHGTGLIMTTSGSECQVVGDSGSSGPELPVANFTATPTSGDAPLTVQFNDTSSGSPTSWFWDFGDGTNTTEQNPAHVYDAAGTYTVNLTVTNGDSSDSEVKTDCITATPSLTPIELPQQNGLNLSVINKQRPGLYDDEHPGTYFFNIGNNMYNGGQNAIHISDSYLTPNRTITLSDSPTGTFYINDTGGKGYEDEAILLIAVQENEKSADFSIDLTVEGYKFLDHAADSAPAADEVGTFNSNAYTATLNASQFLRYDGQLVSQTWKPSTSSTGDINMKFFDGQDLAGPKYNLILVDLNTSIVGRNAAYQTTLTNYGSPKVTYTIHDYSGGNVSFAPYAYVSYQTGGGSYFDRTVGWTSRSSTSSWLVTLGGAETAPVADFTANVTSGDVPLAVQFNDTSTGSPTAWAWDFGDNVTSDQQNPVHTYTEAGTYSINLTVSNDHGSDTEVKTNYITVAVPSGGDAPDLAVSTLSTNNGEVFSASNNTYTATITNIGTGDAGGFAVGFNVSGTTGTVAVAGLAAGANTNVTWTDETIRDAGDVVTITADAASAITESNEANNQLSIEKTVVHNGYRGMRWTDGKDITTAATYDVRGDLVYSSGNGAYLSADTDWTDYTVTWTAGDLAVPANATVAAARLYVPYTDDKGPVFPENVTLTFNGETVAVGAAYEDEKGWGTSTYYPYGMTVYDVTDTFRTDGNLALLANTFPGGGNVSVRGMLLAVVYDDAVTTPHTVIINEGFDLLYGGEAQSTTPEQATAYAPFAGLDIISVQSAILITVAPGAGSAKGDLIFNGQTWTNVWNYTGTSQTGVDERDVTSLLLTGENIAAFRSDGDWMEAAAAFLVVEYPAPPGSILVTSTPDGAAVWLDGEDTGEVTPITLENVPAGDHVVTLKRDGYADASAPITVLSGETAEVDLALTTLTGSLAVTSTPAGASIFIDGADTGEVTNATIDGVAVGEHTVTLRKDGYVDATAEVTIEYDATATLHLDLAEALGGIAVTSMPTGAAIFLDGTDTGKTTNATLEDIRAGEHTVTVTKAGYADATASVTVEHGETTPVHFALSVPTGSIQVTSTPDGARIFLDGADTGEVTNATLTNVPVGDHTVRVELEGYLVAEEAVTVTAGGTASCYLDLNRIVMLPVADFNADVTSGAAPLTVTFTDVSTGDPTAWNWTFGDGEVSSEQNPVHTYVAAGTYAVTLTVTNGDGSNSTVKTDYISVTPPQGDQTRDTPLDIPGCNITEKDDGTREVTINTTTTNTTVTGNTIRIEEGNFTLTIETEGAPTIESGTVNGTVAGITLNTAPVTTTFDTVGTVSASLAANLTGIPSGAALETSISATISPDAESAFQLAASADGLNLGDVAYTMNIVRTNLDNGQDITGATIRMAVSPAWVEAHGGVDAIWIIRSAEDGTKEVLATTLVGTDADGNMVFEASSPNGLSIFGLAAVSAVPQATQPSSSGSSGTSTAVGAASNLKPGESVTFAMDATAISAVTLTAKTDVRDLMVTLAKGSLPQAAELPAGTVYQYVQATLYKATEADFSSVQLRFAVPATWLAEHGCTAEQVRLLRYAEGAWQEAPVEVLGEEDGGATFSAGPDGFGLFAIAATGQASGMTGDATPQPIATETPIKTEVTAIAAGSTPTPQATPLPAWVAVLAFGVLFLAKRRT